MSEFQLTYPYQGRPRVITAHGGWAAYNPADPQVWPTFEAADAARAALLRSTPHMTELRVVIKGGIPSDLDWRTREKLRFGDGTYTKVPWHDEPWYQAKHNDLFAFMSNKKPGDKSYVPGGISFTENEAKGAIDKQAVPMKPGRFLNRFFSDVLTNGDIEGWCNAVAVEVQSAELKITQDADEIEDLYVNGDGKACDSCMTYPASHFDSSVHPVRVYAGPDLALAYIGTVEGPLARTVIWPGRKIYTRIYPHSGGDRARLIQALEDAGYHEGSLNGARVRRIVDEGSYVVPYIDCGQDLSDDGDYLTIGGGVITSKRTDGTAPRLPVCLDCLEEATCLYSVEGWDEDVCESCRDDGATYCSYSGDYYPDDGWNACVEVYGGHYGGREGAENISQRYADSYRGGFVYIEAREEYWLKSKCFECADCGEWFHNDDLVEHNDEQLCSGCHDNIELIDDTDEDQHNAHVLARNGYEAAQRLILAMQRERQEDARIAHNSERNSAPAVFAGALTTGTITSCRSVFTRVDSTHEYTHAR